MRPDSPGERIIKYVRERHCPGRGGFCFYRLEEPGGADTYYALRILRALDQPFSDEKTVSFLRDMQKPDGSYDSIFSAFYSLKGLQLLNKNPLHDPSSYILGKMAQYHIDAENIPAEITSIFKRLLFLVDLYDSLGLERSRKVEGNIERLVRVFQNQDGGFGPNNSSLDETAKALRILQVTASEIDYLRIREFIKNCETPLYGFTDVPGTSLSYIEHIYAGLTASRLASHRPGCLGACAEFISGCLRTNGGFSRSISDGIATLEGTYYAVNSSMLIKAF